MKKNKRKILDNNTNIKKIKIEPVINDEDSLNNENNEVLKQEFSNTEVNQLTGKLLRKSLNTEDGINILKKFINMSETSKDKDLIGDYLQAGGNILEILKLLDVPDKKHNLSHAATVFSAVYLIIMRILADYPQYQPSAEQACRHILNSYSSLIHTMMSNQSNPKQRKTILRLLTSMVTLGGNLPRELLNHLSFHPQVLEFLSQQTKPTDLESVRICFIHFILAFLVDGNVSIIKSLLEKRGMLSSIFPGLIYDFHEVVHLVLTTVKNNVLENSSIMKTLKLHVFSTPVVQSLVNLYNWKGPKNWSVMNKKHGNKVEHVDCVEKEVAVTAVHTFLTTLLTSNRHGIIFNDKTLGTSGRMHNRLVNTVLQSLDKPWEHEKPCDLVIKILSVCPDLVKPQLKYTEAYLEPRLSRKWIEVMQFVCKISESIDLDNDLKPYIIELNLSQLTNISLTLTMSSIVLKTAIQPAFNDTSIILRHHALILLTVVVKQMRKFLNIVKNHFSEADYRSYQSTVVNYMQKNVPSVKDVLLMWNKTLTTANDQASESLSSEMTIYLPEKIDHLALIIELLENYRDISLELVNMNNLKMLNKEEEVCLLTNLNIEHISTASKDKFNKIRVKTIEINIQLNSAAYIANEKQFAQDFIFLISLLYDNSHTISSELEQQIKNTCNVLLRSLKILEGCEEQIDIWINCFGYLKNDQKMLVVKWFVKVVKQIVKNQKLIQNNTIDTVNINDGNMHKNENDLKSPNKSSNVKIPMSRTPMALSTAINHLRDHPNEYASIYTSYVIVLTLHYQSNPSDLENLLENISGLPFKYVSSWENGTPVSLKKYFPQNIISYYSKVLLSNKESINFEQLFSGNKQIQFDYGNKAIRFQHQLTVYEASNILQMIVFYLTQLIRCKLLDQELCERFKLSIIAFLNISKSLNDEEKNSNIIERFSRIIFEHPIILQYFSVITNEDSFHEVLVANLIDICKTTVALLDKKSTLDILYLFKNKLQCQLNELVGTANRRRSLSSFAVEFIEIFKYTNAEVRNLLKNIVELPNHTFVSKKNNLSSWGLILPKLLELLTTESSDTVIESLDPKIVHKVVNHLINLKSKGRIRLIKTWEMSLVKLLSKHPECISIIDATQMKKILENNLSSTSISFIGLIISKNDKLIPLLIESSKQNEKLQDKNIIIPIVAHNLDYKWDQDFLDEIFNRYSEEIFNYFTFASNNNESNDVNYNWIINNISSVCYLITSCFNENIFNKISCKLLTSGDKLESVDIHYIKLLRALYKHGQSFKNSSEVIKEFVHILIRIIVYYLKKNAKNEKILHILCEYLSEAIDNGKQSNDFSFDEITKNSYWPQFVRFSLKYGIKKCNKNNQLPENEDHLTSIKKEELCLLEVIAKIVEVSYQDNSNDNFVTTIFSMATSHSEFINLMLNNDNPIKKQMLQLIRVLVYKNPTLMSSSQIPLFLSAYNATLSASDQLILLILQHYEASRIKLSHYKPYLWGEAAVHHYSIRGDIDTSLLRQPTVAQLLELFNEDIINNTIMNFPIERQLKSTQLHYPSDSYDPAFFLPLLVSSLSVDNVIQCHKVIRSGVLALIFASCGSSCGDIRLAAFTALSRFYFHLEATSNKNKLLWMRFIDALRNGIAQSTNEKHTDGNLVLRQVQLNHFISTFLAKATLISARPVNLLFVPIQSFLMAKPALDLRGIPEFLTLFQSSDINHKIYRHWILEVIRDGIKTDLDSKLAFKFSVFRMLLDFYQCILADNETKNLILQVMHRTTKISKSCFILIRDYSFLIWLHKVAQNIQKYDCKKIELMLDIIENLFDGLTVKADDLSHYKFVLFKIMNCLNVHTLQSNINVSIDKVNLSYKYENCWNLITKSR